MKIRIMLATAGLAVAALGASTSASAQNWNGDRHSQNYRDDHRDGDHRGYDRHDERRDDRWNRGRHYGWDRHHRHCWVEWRHHHRVTVCR